MKIVIVGPGAMGCLFAAFLSRVGHAVFLLDKSGKRTGRIRKKGIYIEGVSGKFIARKIKIITLNKNNEPAELVIIATKSYDTEEAVKCVLPLVGPECLVLTLQNGLGNVDIIGKHIPRRQIIAGVTAEGATLLREGHVRHAGRGETVIGWISKNSTCGSKDKIKAVADIFSRAGFKTRITAGINNLIWSKLVVNAGINALTALTGLNNGRLPELKWTRQIMRDAVSEAVRVARGKDIKLDYASSLKKTESVCRLTAKNISSMLQDVLRKRRTEIDFINGTIVKEGRNLNIPVPVNTVLTCLVKAVESNYKF